MDNLVLNLLVGEISQLIKGCRVTDVVAAGEGVVLRLQSSDLFFGLRPQMPVFMARPQGVARRSPYSGFAARLREAILGFRIDGINKELSDRVVFIHFRKGRHEELTLVYHSIPGRTNLLLLDADQKTITRSRSGEEEYYKPLNAPPGDIDLFGADDEEISQLLQHAGGAKNPVDEIQRSLRGADRLLSTEIAERLKLGIEEALLFIGRIRKRDYRAALFQRSVENGTSLLLLPEIYRTVEATAKDCFEDPNDAADQYLKRRLRFESAGELQDRIKVALDNMARRVTRLSRNLKKDLVRSEEDQNLGNLGDLILANLGSVTKGDEFVEVEDIFKGDGSVIRIALDPALEPAANAERYYGRARKAKRAVQSIRGRIEESEEQYEQLKLYLERLETISDDLKQLRSLQKEIISRGWLTQRQQRELKVSKPARPRFLSSDGLEILVGRNSADNEVVTFRVSRDNDFWFHTAGYAGSHVIVRNAKRLQQPPRRTLAEAAALAAYFSKARQSSNVQVNWTQRRFVKKVKGGPPGKVVLRSYRSTTADPEIPATVREA